VEVGGGEGEEGVEEVWVLFLISLLVMHDLRELGL
jgi:hypothetical protein